MGIKKAIDLKHSNAVQLNKTGKNYPPINNSS